jgi:hypothetical protein
MKRAALYLRVSTFGLPPEDIERMGRTSLETPAAPSRTIRYMVFTIYGLIFFQPLIMPGISSTSM